MLAQRIRQFAIYIGKQFAAYGFDVFIACVFHAIGDKARGAVGELRAPQAALT